MRKFTNGSARSAIRRLVVVGASGLLVGAALPAVPASAAPVTCGFPVTQSIRLENDLVCGSGDGLNVGGQGIDVDLNGHTISGPGGQTSGAGVRVTFGSGVTVRNGTIRGFAYGVLLDRTSADRVESLRLAGNGQGVLVSRTVDSLVEDNRATENQISGVTVFLSTRIRVAHNRLRGNTTGITLDYASATTVTENRVTRSARDGIAVLPTSFEGRNIVSRNTAAGNADDGIDVDAPSTTITRNTASGNTDLGIEAVAGVTDGGGNIAWGNGNPLQCTGVTCYSP